MCGTFDAGAAQVYPRCFTTSNSEGLWLPSYENVHGPDVKLDNSGLRLARENIEQISKETE